MPAQPVPMDFDAACYWQRDGWCVEEKLDGVRCLMHCGPQPVATGRLLKPLRNQAVAANWNARLDGCMFDGELLPDGAFWIFDVLQFRSRDVRRRPLGERRALLRSLADWLPDHARVLPHFSNVRALGDFAEGVVWKRLASRYGMDWFKAKRTVTLDVRILSNDRGVAETEEHGKVRGVPQDVPPGACIECIAYGVHPSGKLKTGLFLRVRDDK